MRLEMEEQNKMKPIRKEILHPGNAYIELKPGTRVSLNPPECAKAATVAFWAVGDSSGPEIKFGPRPCVWVVAMF